MDQSPVRTKNTQHTRHQAYSSSASANSPRKGQQTILKIIPRNNCQKSTQKTTTKTTQRTHSPLFTCVGSLFVSQASDFEVGDAGTNQKGPLLRSITLHAAPRNRPTNIAVMPPQIPSTSHPGARLPTMRMNHAATALDPTVVVASQRNCVFFFFPLKSFWFWFGSAIDIVIAVDGMTPKALCFR